MKKLFTLILQVLFISAFANTQTIIDSLENKLKSATGEEKIQGLNALAKEYSSTSPEANRL